MAPGPTAENSHPALRSSLSCRRFHSTRSRSIDPSYRRRDQRGPSSLRVGRRPVRSSQCRSNSRGRLPMSATVHRSSARQTYLLTSATRAMATPRTRWKPACRVGCCARSLGQAAFVANTLQQAGLIRYRRGHIQISNLDDLRRSSATQGSKPITTGCASLIENENPERLVRAVIRAEPWRSATCAGNDGRG